MSFLENTLPDWAVKIFGIVPWLLAAFVFIWIVSLRFPLSGVFRVDTDMTGNPFVYPFLPSERTLPPGDYEDGWRGQRIVADPVYFSARVPGSYTWVDIDMEFRPVAQPLIELGLARDAAGTQLDLQPWYSGVLEQKDWRRITLSGGLEGYVYHQTPSDFLRDGSFSQMATWYASATALDLADPTPSDPVSWDISLRGSHDFWVVPTAGEIDFELALQDVNRNRSGGILAVRVTRNGEDVFQDAVRTGGTRDRGYGQTFPYSLRLRNQPAGVYRVQLISDDDVFIRRVTTRNTRWVIGPRLSIGDVVGFEADTRSFSAWTTARHLVAETFHAEGKQQIRLGSVEKNVDRTHTAYRMDRTDQQSEPVLFFSPVGDVRIIADGFFSLSPEAFFQPEPRRFTDQTQGASEGLLAVRTSYQRTEDLGNGWRRARRTYSIPTDLNQLRFVLSVPGIDSRSGSVDVRRVRLTYRRDTLSLKNWWDIILNELRLAWRRL